MTLKGQVQTVFQTKAIKHHCSCPLQTYVCCSYFLFLSRVIYIFPLFQRHYHMLPYPKAKEKQKLPEIEKN